MKISACFFSFFVMAMFLSVGTMLFGMQEQEKELYVFPDQTDAPNMVYAPKMALRAGFSEDTYYGYGILSLEGKSQQPFRFPAKEIEGRNSGDKFELTYIGSQADDSKCKTRVFQLGTRHLAYKRLGYVDVPPTLQEQFAFEQANFIVKPLPEDDSFRIREDHDLYPLVVSGHLLPNGLHSANGRRKLLSDISHNKDISSKSNMTRSIFDRQINSSGRDRLLRENAAKLQKNIDR